MIKYSRQREAIVQYLTGRTDHPSAETVYQALRQTHPNISLGTVYRNLGVLEENGQLMRIPMDNGSDRFDPMSFLIITFYAANAAACRMSQ